MRTWNRPAYELGLSFVAMATALGLLATELMAGDESNPKQASPRSASAKKAAKKSRKKLSGAELYAIHCNRCHAERYAPERTEAQWQTILLHMRTRANLPAEQARAILKFLQEDSGK